MRQKQALKDNVDITKQLNQKFKKKEQYRKNNDSLPSGSTTEPEEDYFIGFRIVQNGKDLQQNQIIQIQTPLKFAASNFKNQPIIFTKPDFANYQ